MRTPEDAVRSLARYAALALEDRYEVRFAEVPEAFERPFAVVGPAGPLLQSGPAVHTDCVLPCSIHLWPVRGKDPEDALLLAMRDEVALADGFRVGVGLGGPMRVPLWDYAGCQVDDESVTRGLSDYLRVNDLSLTRIRDQEDPNYWEVVADVRIGWRRRGRVPSGTEVVRRVNTTPGTPA